jgi:hypothetical protein
MLMDDRGEGNRSGRLIRCALPVGGTGKVWPSHVCDAEAVSGSQAVQGTVTPIRTPVVQGIQSIRPAVPLSTPADSDG